MLRRWQIIAKYFSLVIKKEALKMMLICKQKTLKENGFGQRFVSLAKGLYFRTYFSFFLLMIPLVFVTGCGGGGDHMDLDYDGDLSSGTFLDSAVEGLRYQTATQSGFTDMEGMFFYKQGETIQFYMGDVMLGEAPASEYMTPVDLVPGAIDEMDPTVTNICRLLQTVDEDGDSENGIYIPPMVNQMMFGSNISFDMPIEDFEGDTDVAAMIEAMDAMGGNYGGRMMTAPNVAQAHMRNTLFEMMGMMDGTIPMAMTGYFIDSAVQGLHYYTDTQSGVTDMNGAFSYLQGETVQFYMGNVLIGEGTAKSFMTPVNLVPGATDETHPTVTNIGRFLQTMDMDADPTNGINLPGFVTSEMRDRHIDFTMHPDDFGMHEEVVMLMATIGALDQAYYDRVMVSSQSAQAHMGETLSSMEDGGNMVNEGNNGVGMHI